MKKLLISLGFLALLAPISALAAEFKVDSEKTVTVAENTAPRNLYVAGKNVDVDPLVASDLVAAGNNVTVLKGATGSLFAAGNNIDVKGEVGGSARIAGSIVTYGADTEEDLLIGGSSITLKDDVTIAGDALIAGSDITIGNVHILGDLKAAAATVTIGGVVDGNAVIRGATTVALSDNTIINGDFTYYAEEPVVLGANAQIKGKTEFHKISTSASFSNFKDWAYVEGMIYKLFCGLLVSFFLAFCFKKFAKTLTGNTVSNFWSNSGWGFLTLIGLPIIAIILFSLFIAPWFGFAAILLYTLYIMLAAGALSIVLGSFVDKVVNKKKEYELNWKIVLIGTFFTFLLGFVKILGPLVLFVSFVAIFGSLIAQTFAYLKKR
ncbi:MAG: hypothetical protein WC227_03440 [Patescibacteria group bacterium]